MPNNLVIDTGPLVALLDRSERNHVACVEVVSKWRGKLITTEAVLTEALYLLNATWQAQQNCLEMFTREAILLLPTTSQTLRRVATLMKKYEDVPMDYADATLVVLCEELNSNAVFTLDRRGFSAYRMNGRKTFEVIP
jgi:uncharacterized protein